MGHAISSGRIAEPFTFHDIRAKHATDKEELELNAQLALGHPDAATTARYIRSRKGRKNMPLSLEFVERAPRSRGKKSGEPGGG